MNRQVPPALWVSLVALGLISVVQIGAGISGRSVPALVAVVLNFVLAVGLYRGARWAFILILLFGIAGSVVALAKSPGLGLGVLLGNAIVLVPVALSHAYFFGPERSRSPSEVRYCPQCGRPTTAPPTPKCPVCNPT
jgi:hypothetical protein